MWIVECNHIFISCISHFKNYFWAIFSWSKLNGSSSEVGARLKLVEGGWQRGPVPCYASTIRGVYGTEVIGLELLWSTVILCAANVVFVYPSLRREETKYRVYYNHNTLPLRENQGRCLQSICPLSSWNEKRRTKSSNNRVDSILYQNAGHCYCTGAN